MSASIEIDIRDEEPSVLVFSGSSTFELVLGSVSVTMTMEQFDKLCAQMRAWIVDDAAPAGSWEVEDWMVELFDEVYEREWNRAADEAYDRHKAIIGPADRHATREAIAALLRKLQQGAGEGREG